MGCCLEGGVTAGCRSAGKGAWAHPRGRAAPRAAGTRRGITTAQLDVKLPGGVPLEVLEEAVRAAARGRAKILSAMEQAVPQVRACTAFGDGRARWVVPVCAWPRHPWLPLCCCVSCPSAHPPPPPPFPCRQARPATAPAFGSVRVPEAMLGRVIGPGGSMLRELEEAHDAKVDVQDSGGCGDGPDGVHLGT